MRLTFEGRAIKEAPVDLAPGQSVTMPIVLTQ